jgi:hypothetical protein
VRLTDHVTLNFNNNVATAAVVFDIEKASDTTGHSGLLYYMSEFSTSLIEIIAFFLSDRKFYVFVVHNFSMPTEIAAEVP